MTTDGSIGELKRPGYIAAENQTIDELKKLGKPFIVLLNSVKPYSDETAKLAREMSETYQVSVLPVNCEQLKKDDVFHILERVLKEFPVTEIDFHIPKWLEILPSTHWLKAQVIQAAKGVVQKVAHMKDVAGELAGQGAEAIDPFIIGRLRPHGKRHLLRGQSICDGRGNLPDHVRGPRTHHLRPDNGIGVRLKHQTDKPVLLPRDNGFPVIPHGKMPAAHLQPAGPGRLRRDAHRGDRSGKICSSYMGR